MRKALLVILCSCIALPVDAGTFEVAPVTMTLDGSNMGVFYVTNRGSRPIMAQVEGFDWRQPDGAKDDLAQTGAAIISPPIMRLLPGVQQTVRFMIRSDGNDDGVERAYRFVVSEIPDLAAAESDNVRMLLQFSVPVFVARGKKPEADLRWSIHRDDQGMTLTARNGGNGHAKISQIALADGAGKIFRIDEKKFRYILAGAYASWALPKSAAQVATLRVKAFDEIGGNTIETSLALH